MLDKECMKGVSFSIFAPSKKVLYDTIPKR